MTDTVSPKPTFDQKDVQDNKVVACLAYVLFFIPLLAAKDSKFAKEHAKQGLVFFIASILITIVGSIIPILGWLIILPLGYLAILIVAVIAIVKTLQGEFWEIPLIGQYRSKFNF